MNTGDKRIVLDMFFLPQERMAFVVQPPEIPMN